MLLENQDVVLTRDRLLNQVWGYSFDGESRTVDVHIRTLRQKLMEAGELIETVRGDPGDPASRRRRQRPEVRRTGQLHRVGDVGRLLLKVPGVLPAHLVISKAGENPHAHQDRAQGRQQAAAVDLPAQAQGAGPHGRTPIL